jgi:hypothetical protein
MTNLTTTTNLVKEILEEDKQARNSDSFLYLKVLERFAEQKGINLWVISVPTFLFNIKDFGFPPFETVRRARQKVQQHRPDLAACEKVEAMRQENEQIFREYARGDVS